MKIFKYILLVLFLQSALLSNANLYVFVFKDGAALKDTKIKLDKYEVNTNEYGYALFNVPSDTYDVGYYKNGKLFALNTVNIVDEQDSQLFLNLKKEFVVTKNIKSHEVKSFIIKNKIPPNF